MSTPLRLARDLRLAFPQFHDVKIVREAPWTLRAYCLISPGAEAPRADVERWVNANHMLGTVFNVEQVAAFPPDLVDEEVLLRRTKLKRVVVEEAAVNRQGLLQNLRNAFPGQILGISEPGNGIAVHVAADVPPERDQEIIDATRVLTICDFKSLTVTRQQPAGATGANAEHRESKAAVDLLNNDRGFLEDYLPDVLDGVAVQYPAPLPSGSATYASVHDGIHSLHQRLALFERVFIFVPFKAEDFPRWAGTSFDDFISALPSGRIVPVFSHTVDRYEAGLVSKIVDGGPPRVLLPGEATLRAVETFTKEHPLLTLFHADEAALKEARLALRQVADDPNARLITGYIEAVADVASRIAGAAMTGPALAMGWHPIAQWLDTTAQNFGLPSRELELGTAIDHRIMTEAIRGRPMTQVGHYLDGHLMFVYGARPGDDDVLRIPDPELIGRIAFPDTKGLSLREFAESFRGPIVDAMRALMSTERVQTASATEDLVKQFNAELKQYSHVAGAEYVAVATLLTVVGAFTAGVPCALAALTLDLARRVLGRNAPGVFSTVTAKMTGSTREGALLARVKAQE